MVQYTADTEQVARAYNLEPQEVILSFALAAGAPPADAFRIIFKTPAKTTAQEIETIINNMINNKPALKILINRIKNHQNPVTLKKEERDNIQNKKTVQDLEDNLSEEEIELDGIEGNKTATSVTIPYGGTKTQFKYNSKTKMYTRIVNGKEYKDHNKIIPLLQAYNKKQESDYFMTQTNIKIGKIARNFLSGSTILLKNPSDAKIDQINPIKTKINLTIIFVMPPNPIIIPATVVGNIPYPNKLRT